MTVEMKTCSGCQTGQPLEEFNRDIHTTSGLQSWCKECKRVGMLKLMKERRADGRVVQMLARRLERGETRTEGP